MNEAARQAMVDMWARRFMFSMGDRTALAPHEIEGYITELRNSIAALDACELTPEVTAIRDEARKQLELFEEMA